MKRTLEHLADTWNALQAATEDLHIDGSDLPAGSVFDRAAADLVTYILAGQPIDRTSLPDDLTAHLDTAHRFDDAAWEQQPTYIPALETIRTSAGTTAAEHAHRLLVELAGTAARLSSRLTDAERFQISRLRHWQPEHRRTCILLVHGMAQQHHPDDDLTRTWHEHLQISFDNAGIAAQAPDGTRLAYYADLLDGWPATERPSPAALLQTLTSNLSGRRSHIEELLPQPTSTSPSLPRPDLLEPALRIAVEVARGRSDLSVLRSILTQRPLLEVTSTPLNDAKTTHRPSRARAARTVGHLLPTARTSIVKRLSEVWLYLTDTTFRYKVQDRLDTALDGSTPTVIIGHSLGSVVAMDHLLRQGRPLPALVTLGSPLWMPTVLDRLLRWHAGRRPVAIDHWTNLYDGRDIVGGGHPMARAWGHGPTDIKVTNGDGPLHHSIADYLQHAEVAKAINTAISIPPAQPST